MQKTLLKVAVLGAVMSLAAPVFSEVQSGFTLSPMVGYTLYDGAEDFRNDRNATIAAGYKFASPWAFEVAYLLKGDASSRNGGGNFDVDQIRLDALYHFETNTRWQPYAVFGVGESEYESKNGSASSTEAILNGGAGLNFFLTDLFSLRADARAIQNLDTEVTDFAFNVGARFIFGSTKSKATPVVVKEPETKDTDQDGVIDSIDACPFTAAGATVDETGCEINNDVDGDGVLNAADKCPDTQAGAKVDEAGCYIILKDNVTVKLNVNFGNNSDQIVSGADQIGDLARFMKEHPLTKVVVEGYTDSRGSDAYNQALSQKRAFAVAERLSSDYGIAKSRVTAVGYGEANPVASNDTAEGRAKNRRVSGVVSAIVERIVK